MARSINIQKIIFNCVQKIIINHKRKMDNWQTDLITTKVQNIIIIKRKIVIFCINIKFCPQINTTHKTTLIKKKS